MCDITVISSNLPAMILLTGNFLVVIVPIDTLADMVFLANNLLLMRHVTHNLPIITLLTRNLPVTPFLTGNLLVMTLLSYLAMFYLKAF